MRERELEQVMRAFYHPRVGFLQKYFGKNTWLNSGQFLRIGESIDNGMLNFTLRGKWIDQITGQVNSHVKIFEIGKLFDLMRRM